MSYNSPNSAHFGNRYNLCCLFHLPEKDSKLGKQYKGRPTGYKNITYSAFFKHKNIQTVTDIWEHNLQTLAGMIQYCADNNFGLRISSSLFPLATHPEVEKLINYQQIREKVAGIDLWFTYLRDLVAETKIRLSMHPGQFNVLESNDSNTVKNAIKELNWHGWFLDQLGCPQNHWSPINLHIHTSKGNFHDLAGRFIRGFLQLDHSVKSRLTLENNDKGGEMSMDNTPWHCENLLEFRRIAAPFLDGHNIPLCFDNLHDWLLPSPNLSSEQCFQEFYSTWPEVFNPISNKNEQITPVFHHSESSDPASRCKSHADLPSFIPKNYGKRADWDVELKFKQGAIKKLIEIR